MYSTTMHTYSTTLHMYSTTMHMYITTMHITVQQCTCTVQRCTCTVQQCTRTVQQCTLQYNNTRVQYNAHVQYNSSYCNNCPLIKNARNVTALYCEISQYGAQRNAHFLFLFSVFVNPDDDWVLGRNTYVACPENFRMYRIKIFQSYLEAIQPCRLQSTPSTLYAPLPAYGFRDAVRQTHY
jgi:hypothetical protein